MAGRPVSVDQLMAKIHEADKRVVASASLPAADADAAKWVGFKEVRPTQRDVFHHCGILGKDGFVVDPTGGGKTAAAIMAAMARGGVTVLYAPTTPLFASQNAALVKMLSDHTEMHAGE
jgi:superfamily II DNA helicase RecQ